MKQENVKLLKAQQEALENTKDIFKVKKLEFEKENAGIIREVEIIEDLVNTTKEKVKADAMIEFNLTGEKKLFGGIGIRVSKTLDYDKTDAVNWALDNMKVAVYTELDKKQFEGYAKKNELNFVKVEETTSVTFPKEIKLE